MSMKRQQGAALLVSLMLLVIALLLSISSMQSSRMEESMAGNYRATERALMAAENGASEIIARITSQIFDGSDLEKLESELSGNLGKYTKIEDGVYFKLAQQGSGLMTTSLTSVGIVTSGIAEDSPSSIPSEQVVAQREVDFRFSLSGFGNLSAVNPMCTSAFSVPSNPSGAEGDYEEVSGVKSYKPAISAGSEREAVYIVYSIYNQNHGRSINDSFFGPSGGVYSEIAPTYGQNGRIQKSGAVADAFGVYHSAQVIAEVDGAEGDKIKIADYTEGCNNPGGSAGNDRMCAYKGGVSPTHGADILADAQKFHKFIGAIFNDDRGSDYVVFHDSIALGDNDFSGFQDSKVNIYTDRLYQFSGGAAGGDLKSAWFFTDEGVLEPLDADGNRIVDENNVEVSLSVLEQVAYNAGGDVVFLGSEELNPSELYLAKDQGESGSGYYFPSTHEYYDGYWYDHLVEGEGRKSYVIDGGPKDLRIYSDGELVGVRRNIIEDNDLSASGVLVIDGNVTFQGNPSFEGVIIVLGDVAIGGGGNENFKGAVIAAPYYYDHEGGDDNDGAFVCQNMKFDTSGGGNHKIIFDEELVARAFGELLSTEALEAWLTGNDPETFRYELSSWSESAINKVVLD